MKNFVKNINVSVVEDNLFIRMALEKMLVHADGFQVSGIYASGEEAVHKMPDNVPDVVLMDINLGGMSGIEVVRIIKNKYPSIRFMICTVYEDDEKIFDALSAGASGYILKTTKYLELLDAIKDLYEGGAPMSSQIARRVVASFSKKEERRDHSLLENLSFRENEILGSLVKGRLYKEIAVDFSISPETVRKHVYNIYRKLHVNNRIEAYNKYFGHK